MARTTIQELFDSLSSALVLYARQWCHTPEDAVQEAFVDLAQCTPEPISPKAWLYTTTRRKAQNIARSETRHRYHLDQLSKLECGKRNNEYWMEGKTRNGIDASEVMAGLESLNSEQREMVIAKVWGELTFEELAELMNCSPASAYRRYVSALSELRCSILNTGPIHTSMSNTGARS